MPFTNAAKFLLVLLAAFWLGACSSIGQKNEPEPVEEVEEIPLAEGEEAPFVLIPSPYVASDVPAQAVREFDNIKSLMTAQKWGEAKSSLELMIQTFPKLSGPYVNLGIVHYQLGEFEDAEQALTFAIETNPLNFDAYARLGLLYREQGRFSDAEQTYLNALELWPHHQASAVNLGILYDLYMGRLEEALSYYELSQQIAGGEDRTLRGWIADIKRRISAP